MKNDEESIDDNADEDDDGLLSIMPHFLIVSIQVMGCQTEVSTRRRPLQNRLGSSVSACFNHFKV